MYAKGKNKPPHNTCTVGEENGSISPKEQAIYGWSKKE